MRYLMFAILSLVLGCSESPPESTVGGIGGTGGGSGGDASASVSVSSASSGGASTGGGGSGGEEGCSSSPGDGYPALLSYDPAAPLGGAVGPYPEETPNGAAAGRFGPTATGSVSTWVGVVGDTPQCDIPDPVTFALWTEPLCGLPTRTPPWQAAPLSEFTQEPAGFGAVRLSHALPPVTLGDDSGFSALRLTTPKTCAVAFEYSGEGDASRAIWLGRVDVDGDGLTDAELGWAELANPTDPSVAPFSYDLGFGAQ